MRRNTVRLVLAIAATSFLAACADLSTGPSAPKGTRFDEAKPSASDSVDTTRSANQQGSQV